MYFSAVVGGVLPALECEDVRRCFLADGGEVGELAETADGSP